MLKRRDVWLVGLLAVVAATVLLVLPRLGAPADVGASYYIRYSIDGVAVQTLSLAEERDIMIDQGEDMQNLLHIWPGGVEMESATCYNQSCVYQGEVTPENMDQRPLLHMIVCAPHRLVVELLPAQEVGANGHAQ